MPLDQPAVSVPVGRPTASAQPRERRPETDARPGTTSPALTPPIDIYDGPDGLVLEADLPGVPEEDLSIQLEDNVLTLRGRVAAGLPPGARALHEEYRPGDFGRSFILSDEVDRGRIAASLKNGVLRITLPRAERVRTRKIEIKSS